jgi:hypothetical protein
MRERQKQLAKMRALMSYYELKRQRINKIKSKTYHRKLKKEKERKQMVCIACYPLPRLPLFLGGSSAGRSPARPWLMHASTGLVCSRVFSVKSPYGCSTEWYTVSAVST